MEIEKESPTNVKALRVACALGAVFFYCIYVSFILMSPIDYRTGVDVGGVVSRVPFDYGAGGLLGLVQAVVFGAFIGLVIGTLHNFFQHRWAASH